MFVGKIIKKQRIFNKISLDKASKDLNIPKDILSKIENDEIDEYSNGNRIYRDKDGFIISEKEWKEQN